MTNEQLDQISKWAQEHPRQFMAMQAAILLRSAGLEMDLVRVFLESMGRRDGTKFIGLLEDVIIEDSKKEQT